MKDALFGSTLSANAGAGAIEGPPGELPNQLLSSGLTEGASSVPPVLRSKVTDKEAKRSAHLWECVGSTPVLSGRAAHYHVRMKPEYDFLSGLNLPAHELAFNANNKLGYAVELPGFLWFFLQENLSLLERIKFYLYETIFEFISLKNQVNSDDLTTDGSVNDDIKGKIELIFHEFLNGAGIDEAEQIVDTLTKTNIINVFYQLKRLVDSACDAGNIDTEKFTELPDAFVTYSCDQGRQRTMQVLRRLGYQLTDNAGGKKILTLPDRKAFLAAWEAMRQERFLEIEWPDITIASDRGIASNRAFIRAILSHDRLLSSGLEFVHDHFYHISTLVNLVLTLSAYYLKYSPETGTHAKEYEHQRELFQTAVASYDSLISTLRLSIGHVFILGDDGFPLVITEGHLLVLEMGLAIHCDVATTLSDYNEAWRDSYRLWFCDNVLGTLGTHQARSLWQKLHSDTPSVLASIDDKKALENISRVLKKVILGYGSKEELFLSIPAFNQNVDTLLTTLGHYHRFVNLEKDPDSYRAMIATLHSVKLLTAPIKDVKKTLQRVSKLSASLGPNHPIYRQAERCISTYPSSKPSTSCGAS